MNYSGIDLHSNNSVVSVIDETDRVVAEKRLPMAVSRSPGTLCQPNLPELAEHVALLPVLHGSLR